jgi:hypothetical protein
LRNESFFSAPQLKRDPLGGTSVKTVTLLAMLLGALAADQRPPTVRATQLKGRWHICFVLDSSISRQGRSSRMTCGTITFQAPTRLPRSPIVPADTMPFDVWLRADHDLHFTPMLGTEPGNGPEGSGTVLSGGDSFILAVNAPRGEFVFDDHSVHARGDLTGASVLRGTWEPSCFRPCPERGFFYMRRLDR